MFNKERDISGYATRTRNPLRREHVLLALSIAIEN